MNHVYRRRAAGWGIGVALCLLGTLAPAQQPAAAAETAVTPKPAVAPETAITLQAEGFRLIVAKDGYVLSFIDTRTGKDYAGKDVRQPFAFLRKGGKNVPPMGCSASGNLITVTFPEGAAVDLKVTPKGRWLVLEVAAARGVTAEELVFGALRLALNKHVSWISGVASDGEFSVAVRALNLKANLRLGGVPSHFEPTCYARYGMVGARIALVGCPAERLRPVLQDL
ncbi:MAG: hypothetical protein IMZ65_02880, partial [Planctomycetes bacterium]|nr:hypothetical protein [Planctomycetota bacterium]